MSLVYSKESEVPMLSFIKVDPTTYVIHFAKGAVKREGKGLSFFYFRPTASIVAVPTASVDVPFIFNEMTADFQPVTLQGLLTYRIADPKKIAGALNFTLAPDGRRYVTEDPDKLGQRLVNMTQVLTRPAVQKLGLKAALTASDEIASAALAAVRGSDAFKALGVEVLAVSLLAVRPTPETAKAIEAEAREELLKKADEAISERRNAAVEQERRIKENELTTEARVQERRQELARSELASQIGLETQREELVRARTENAKKEADARAYAMEASLKPLGALDPRTLEVLALSQGNPRALVAHAMRALAADAGKIGNLTITPDLLSELMREEDGRKG